MIKALKLDLGRRDSRRVFLEGKRILRTIYFTDNGKKVAEKLAANNSHFLFECRSLDEELNSFIKASFLGHLPIVFIGACGIAVRLIAPFIESKLSDSPVVVIDELGENVIPILSGHFGGANEIAQILADHIGARPVITTATDINNVFAIDSFAKKNGLVITDKDGIKGISHRVLAGEQVEIFIEEGINIKGQCPENISVVNDCKKARVCVSKEVKNVFTLIPKTLIIGMGCKKGKTFEELFDFITRDYEEEYLRKNLYGISTIDVKSEETGLIKLAQYFDAKFLVYSAEELKAACGDFSESDFVNSVVGVSNVCERAAILGAKVTNGTLEKKKQADSGMTYAAARIETIDLYW